MCEGGRSACLLVFGCLFCVLCLPSFCIFAFFSRKKNNNMSEGSSSDSLCLAARSVFLLFSFVLCVLCAFLSLSWSRNGCHTPNRSTVSRILESTMSWSSFLFSASFCPSVCFCFHLFPSFSRASLCFFFFCFSFCDHRQAMFQQVFVTSLDVSVFLFPPPLLSPSSSFTFAFSSFFSPLPFLVRVHVHSFGCFCCSVRFTASVLHFFPFIFLFSFFLLFVSNCFCLSRCLSSCCPGSLHSVRPQSRGNERIEEAERRREEKRRRQEERREKKAKKLIGLSWWLSSGCPGSLHCLLLLRSQTKGNLQSRKRRFDPEAKRRRISRGRGTLQEDVCPASTRSLNSRDLLLDNRKRIKVTLICLFSAYCALSFLLFVLFFLIPSFRISELLPNSFLFLCLCFVCVLSFPSYHLSSIPFPSSPSLGTAAPRVPSSPMSSRSLVSVGGNGREQILMQRDPFQMVWHNSPTENRPASFLYLFFLSPSFFFFCWFTFAFYFVSFLLFCFLSSVL